MMKVEEGGRFLVWGSTTFGLLYQAQGSSQATAGRPFGVHAQGLMAKELITVQTLSGVVKGIVRSCTQLWVFLEKKEKEMRKRKGVYKSQRTGSQISCCNQVFPLWEVLFPAGQLGREWRTEKTVEITCSLELSWGTSPHRVYKNLPLVMECSFYHGKRI